MGLYLGCGCPLQYIILYISRGNHTPSTKPVLILHKRVTLPSGNESSIVHWRMTGDESYNGSERGPVDRDGVRRTKSKHSTSSILRPKSEPRLVCLDVEAFSFA